VILIVVVNVLCHRAGELISIDMDRAYVHCPVIGYNHVLIIQEQRKALNTLNTVLKMVKTLH